MTAQHRLELAEPGSFAGARVVCLGTEEDLCRRWCAEGCEEGCWHTPLAAEVELVAQAPVEGHRWEPLGYCREATWLEAVGIEELHADPDGFPFDEDGAAQLGVRSGLIEISWTDDDYVWSYAEPAPPLLPVPVSAGQLTLPAAGS